MSPEALGFGSRNQRGTLAAVAVQGYGLEEASGSLQQGGFAAPGLRAGRTLSDPEPEPLFPGCVSDPVGSGNSSFWQVLWCACWQIRNYPGRTSLSPRHLVRRLEKLKHRGCPGCRQSPPAWAQAGTASAVPPDNSSIKEMR